MEEKTSRFEKLWNSDRLLYKSVDEDDEATVKMITTLFTDPVNTGLSGFGALKPRSRKDAIDFIKKANSKAVLFVIICLPATEEESAASTPIGFLDLHSRWEKGVQAGISIAGAYQNKGYGREALTWALDWGFLWGGIHRFQIGTIAYNKRARALYESLGFVQESQIRSAAWADGQWHDLIEFSMLDHEWQKLRNIAGEVKALEGEDREAGKPESK